MALEKIVEEVKRNLDKNPRFDIQKFVLSKHYDYKAFANLFAARNNLTPQDYKSYSVIKERFRFDEFRQLIIRHRFEDPFLIYIEIAKVKILSVANKNIDFYRKIWGVIKKEYLTLGLSEDFKCFSCNGYNLLLDEVLEKKDFFLNYKILLEGFNTDLYEFKFKRKPKMTFGMWSRKYPFIEIYKMFLKEIYSPEIKKV